MSPGCRSLGLARVELSLPAVRRGRVPIPRPRRSRLFSLPSSHLVTHGVIVGATGSGKTGLVTVTCEEALRAGIPVLMIDVKGDLPTSCSRLPPWTPRPPSHGPTDSDDDPAPEQIADAVATTRRQCLDAWGIGADEMASFVATPDTALPKARDGHNRRSDRTSGALRDGCSPDR